MKKVLALLMLALVLIIVYKDCGITEPSMTSLTDAGQQVKEDKPRVAEVAVIVKATDSYFWQCVLTGADNYAKEHSEKVHVSTYGPVSEADIDKQVSILEDVIARSPDAIVIASTSSDATVPAIEDALAKGIKVVTIDNRVKSDKVLSHVAADNLKGGTLCADKLVEALKASNTPLKGRIGVISAMAGAQALTDRDNGFLIRLKEIAPELEPLPTRYIGNDIMKGRAAAEDLLAAYPDIVGFFADSSHSGDGVARVLRERNLAGRVAAVAYDSDPEEVQALKDGILYALIVQDPYGMGYKGVDSVVKALEGEALPKSVDTGFNAVTRANMDDPAMKRLLDPMTLRK